MVFIDLEIKLYRQNNTDIMTELNTIENAISHLDISSGNNKYENTVIHWHFLDISKNYFNDKIDWDIKGIILNDNKYFTMYNLENIPDIVFPESDIYDILNHTNSQHLVVANVIDYFNTIYIHMFKNTIIKFLKWNKNSEKFASKIQKLEHIDNEEHTNFIIVPTGKYRIGDEGNMKTVMTFGIINTNRKIMKYIYGCSNYKKSVKYFSSLFLNLLSGLSNHFNINGVITSTSFNLCKSFLKHYETKGCNQMFKFRFNNEECNRIIEKNIPLCVLLNHMYPYFPKLQVIWNSYTLNGEKMEKLITDGNESCEGLYKGHDVLYKHNQIYGKDNEIQKRRAIKFHPYSKNKHITNEKTLLEKHRNKEKCYNKPRNTEDDKEFLQLLGNIQLSITVDETFDMNEG